MIGIIGSEKQSLPELKSNQDVKESESNDLSLSNTLKDKVDSDCGNNSYVPGSEKDGPSCSSSREVDKSAKLGLCVRSKCISYQVVTT